MICRAASCEMRRMVLVVINWPCQLVVKRQLKGKDLEGTLSFTRDGEMPRS